jgi:extracellular matrix protein 14
MQTAHTPLIHDLAQTIYESLPSSAPTNPDYPSKSSGTDRSFSPSLNKRPDETNIFFRDYQPLSVIVPWMRLMQSLFSAHVRIIDIGNSYEGRSILGLRVGVHPKNSEKPSERRKTIIITGGIHAREWISTSSVTYAAYALIVSYGRSRQMTKLMEEFDWVFIPTLNPDGYVYTWEHDRLWRKSTQRTSLRFCQGYDIDKSFSFEWDGGNTKGNPCSESFAGESPLQAVEALRFASWVKNETINNNVSIVGYLDLHSYSQQVLYPYAFSCTRTPPTLENLWELGLGLAKAIRATSKDFYGVTSACEGSVAAGAQSRKHKASWPGTESRGGSALDWMYNEIGARYSYQIKLPDTGSYGFLLPKKHIKPTGEAIFGALKYFGNYLLSNKGVESIENSPSSETIQIAMSKFEDSTPKFIEHDSEVDINLDNLKLNLDLKR